MTRFFYPASRAHHAYSMAIDFGMEFERRGGKWSLDGLRNIAPASDCRLFVHPESLGLIEPQVGDVVQNPDDDVARVCLDSEPIVLSGWVKLTVAREFVGIAATIIQRNGNAFHWPEIEP